MLQILVSDPVVIRIYQLIVQKKKGKGKNSQYKMDSFLYAYFCKSEHFIDFM